MITIIILCVSAFVAVLVGLLFVFLGVKYRNEECGPVFIFAVLFAFTMAALSIGEAVKRADLYERK